MHQWIGFKSSHTWLADLRTNYTDAPRRWKSTLSNGHSRFGCSLLQLKWPITGISLLGTSSEVLLGRRQIDRPLRVDQTKRGTLPNSILMVIMPPEAMGPRHRAILLPVVLVHATRREVDIPLKLEDLALPKQLHRHLHKEELLDLHRRGQVNHGGVQILAVKPKFYDSNRRGSCSCAMRRCAQSNLELLARSLRFVPG